MISVFTKRKTIKTSVIVDFMSLVRKISMKRLNTIKDALAYMWKKIRYDRCRRNAYCLRQLLGKFPEEA